LSALRAQECAQPHLHSRHAPYYRVNGQRGNRSSSNPREGEAEVTYITESGQFRKQWYYLGRSMVPDHLNIEEKDTFKAESKKQEILCSD
jgi:hypothetical protein